VQFKQRTYGAYRFFGLRPFKQQFVPFKSFEPKNVQHLWSCGKFWNSERADTCCAVRSM